jgi:hypothetical protein
VAFGRPRLLGAALIGGLGFAAGRASKQSTQAGASQGGALSNAQPDITARLRELTAMHDAGSLTDEEFTAAKAKLLGS